MLTKLFNHSLLLPEEHTSLTSIIVMILVHTVKMKLSILYSQPHDTHSSERNLIQTFILSVTPLYLDVEITTYVQLAHPDMSGLAL